jgi:predicted RNA-binding protein with PUA-like domain
MRFGNRQQRDRIRFAPRAFACGSNPLLNCFQIFCKVHEPKITTKVPRHKVFLVTSCLGGLIFSMNYWIVKSEPEAYSWTAFVKDGKTAWTGVRNFAARLNLRAMKSGDRVLFYHSGEEKSVVGLARVVKEFYSDPTANEGDWSAVDLALEKTLAKPVTLAAIKADKILKEMVMAKQSRLSVSPVTVSQFERLLKLAETKG